MRMPPTRSSVSGVHTMCYVSSCLLGVQEERCTNSAKGKSTPKLVPSGCRRYHKRVTTPEAFLNNVVIHDVEKMVCQWPLTQWWWAKMGMSPIRSVYLVSTRCVAWGAFCLMSRWSDLIILPKAQARVNRFSRAATTATNPSGAQRRPYITGWFMTSKIW